MTKVILLIVSIFISWFVSTWIFNHFSAPLSVFIGVLSILGNIYFAYFLIKKHFKQ